MFNNLSSAKPDKYLMPFLPYEVSGLIGEQSPLPKVGGTAKGNKI
jgi:hypothetical protein